MHDDNTALPSGYPQRSICRHCKLVLERPSPDAPWTSAQLASVGGRNRECYSAPNPSDGPTPPHAPGTIVPRPPAEGEIGSQQPPDCDCDGDASVVVGDVDQLRDAVLAVFQAADREAPGRWLVTRMVRNRTGLDVGQVRDLGAHLAALADAGHLERRPSGNRSLFEYRLAAPTGTGSMQERRR